METEGSNFCRFCFSTASNCKPSRAHCALVSSSLPMFLATTFVLWPLHVACEADSPWSCEGLPHDPCGFGLSWASLAEKCFPAKEKLSRFENSVWISTKWSWPATHGFESGTYLQTCFLWWRINVLFYKNVLQLHAFDLFTGTSYFPVIGPQYPVIMSLGSKKSWLRRP